MRTHFTSIASAMMIILALALPVGAEVVSPQTHESPGIDPNNPWNWAPDDDSRWLAGNNAGLRFFFGGLDNGANFLGSAITAGEDFVTIEVRFAPLGTPGKTQKAYKYLRGGTPNYVYDGYYEVPFTVWDVDANPPRQLNCAFVERIDRPSNNNTWLPTSDASDREFLFIFKSTYSGDDPDPEDPEYVFYTTHRILADAAEFDVLYALWPVARPGHDPATELADGQVFRINANHATIGDVTLRLMDASVDQDGRALVDVVLQSTHEVGGLQFEVVATEDGELSPHAHFVGVVNHLPNFSVLTSTQDDVTTVLVISLTNDAIPPGTIAQLVYEVDPATPPGTVIAVQIPPGSDVLSDRNGQELTHLTFGSVIRSGRRGDLNHDGAVNVLDAIGLINLVIGRVPPPAVGSNEFFEADVNGDGDLNVLDIVRLINIVLGRATGKPVAEPVEPVQVGLGGVQTLPDGRTAVPVQAEFDGMVAGLSLRLTYDPAVLTPGEPIPTADLSGMRVESYATDGTLNVLVYSLEGRGFRSGTGIPLMIPVEIRNGRRADGTVTLAGVIVANGQAERIPAVITTNTVKVSARPAAFALRPNRPNPFNPATRIAYDVPQAAHVALVVYNLLGQEIVRLVDEPKTPGRYEVTWNGRNGQGLSVASGVYLYRLTSSTGFSQTRRMALVK